MGNRNDSAMGFLCQPCLPYFRMHFYGDIHKNLFMPTGSSNPSHMSSNAFVAVNFTGSLGLTSGMFRGLHNHLFYGMLLQVYRLTGIYSSNSVLFPTEASSSNVSLAEVLKRQVGQKLWKIYQLVLLQPLLVEKLGFS